MPVAYLSAMIVSPSCREPRHRQEYLQGVRPEFWRLCVLQGVFSIKSHRKRWRQLLVEAGKNPEWTNGRPLTTVRKNAPIFRPVAIRSTSGHSSDRVRFLNMERIATRLSPRCSTLLGGIFHVTSVTGGVQISKGGLLPGRMVAGGRASGRGRIQVHCAMFHPEDPRGDSRKLRQILDQDGRAAVISLNRRECTPFFDCRPVRAYC